MRADSGRCESLSFGKKDGKKEESRRDFASRAFAMDSVTLGCSDETELASLAPSEGTVPPKLWRGVLRPAVVPRTRIHRLCQLSRILITASPGSRAVA